MPAAEREDPTRFVRLTPRPTWGVGRVLETDGDGKAIVFFESVGAKRLVIERAALENVEQADVAANSVLLHLRGDCLTGPPRQQPRSLADLVKAFKRARPDGFTGVKFQPKQRAYVETAQSLRDEALSAEALRALIEAGAFAEAFDLIRKTALDSGLITATEANRFKSLSADAHEPFVRATFNLLYGEGPFGPRLEALVDAMGEAATWPNVGLMLVLSAPGERHQVRGDLLGKCAEVIGYELDGDGTPSQASYEASIAFTSFVKSQIEVRGLAPRDLIDVEIFLAEATGFNDKPVRRRKKTTRR